MKGRIATIVEDVVSSFIRESFQNHEKEIGDDVLFALNASFSNIIDSKKYSADALQLVDSVIDVTWERLNIGNWKDVPECLRDVYAYASLLKAVTLLLFTLEDDEKNLKRNLIDTLEAVDRGLLLGSSCRKELCRLATTVCSLVYYYSEKRFDYNFSQLTCDETPLIKIPNSKILAEIECPSIESFFTKHFKPRVPIKLKNCMNHWPALKKWDCANYINEKIGPRLVPVEIGRDYTSSEWSQKLMTVESFMDTFCSSNSSKSVGYLAQHQLFNQIPELLDDICEPDYCALSDNCNNEESSTDVNAWFGPAHTVSPLHYDPKHNLLAQVVGSKRILLIDPKWSKNVCPFDDFLLFNTAQVDLENIDYEKFPNFTNTEIFECILEAGEMIYIPPKWWHHVRALTVSFSVSFWW